MTDLSSRQRERAPQYEYSRSDQTPQMYTMFKGLTWSRRQDARTDWQIWSDMNFETYKGYHWHYVGEQLNDRN